MWVVSSRALCFETPDCVMVKIRQSSKTLFRSRGWDVRYIMSGVTSSRDLLDLELCPTSIQ